MNENKQLKENINNKTQKEAKRKKTKINLFFFSFLKGCYLFILCTIKDPGCCMAVDLSTPKLRLKMQLHKSRDKCPIKDNHERIKR